MKVLVICQYYYPEPFRINDICEELVKRGHEVTVVTGEPNYPEGRIYDGYENHQHSDELLNGVHVHRCPIVPRKTGALFRFINYYSYAHKASRYVKNLKASDGNPFDVVFVNQLSPVMMSEPALKYKKRFRVPVVLYCLDLWPESLVAGGISKSSLIFKVFNKISNRIYQSVDRILITSKLFRVYFEEHFGIKKDIIIYQPQYAENLFTQLPYKEVGDVTDLLFAGNIGEVQNVEIIIKAAKKLREFPVKFHIVGGGSDLERLKELSKGLNNITFYGRRSLNEMPDFYSRADALLVTLKSDSILSLTLPGKVQSYMAVGKPIIGAIDGETAEIIKDANCGYVGNAENVDEFVANIHKFMMDTNRAQLGANGRNYYERYFKKSLFMDKLEEILNGTI